MLWVFVSMSVDFLGLLVCRKIFIGGLAKDTNYGEFFCFFGFGLFRVFDWARFGNFGRSD